MFYHLIAGQLGLCHMVNHVQKNPALVIASCSKKRLDEGLTLQHFLKKNPLFYTGYTFKLVGEIELREPGPPGCQDYWQIPLYACTVEREDAKQNSRNNRLLSLVAFQLRRGQPPWLPWLCLRLSTGPVTLCHTVNVALVIALRL